MIIAQLDQLSCSLNKTLQSSASNLLSLRFLNKFGEWSSAQGDPSLVNVTEWITGWQHTFLGSLKPFGKDRAAENAILISLALRLGGIELLEQT